MSTLAGRGNDAKTARQTTAIILAAMPMGVTLFALVTWWIRRGEPTMDPGLMQVIWLAMAVTVVVAAAVVWRRLVQPELPAGGHTADVSGERLGRLQTGLIICMALIEGAALFGVITWFIGGSPVPAAASVVMMWAALLAMWPRPGWYGIR
ncbi:MAG: hypothetical protein ACR2GQ_11070 [Gemmatimonadota bacterium]